MAQKIAAFFDPRGILNTQAPCNWALATSRVRPFHHSQCSEAKHASLNKRRQELNARDTLARAQRKVDAELQASLARFGKTHEVDAQKVRYLRLLFEPLVQLSEEMMEELADELQADEHGGDAGDEGGDPLPRVSLWFLEFQRRHTLSALSERYSSPDASPRPVNGKGGQMKPAGEAVRGALKGMGNFSAGQVLLKGGDRQLLQAVHARYASRVAETGRSEQMKRSTWFRFLHHCGLLGPHGVSFAKASETFEVFADHEAEARDADWEAAGSQEPSLNFASWAGAVQYVLLHASRRVGTEAEIIRTFYDVCLKQCRERICFSESATLPPPTLPAFRHSGGSSGARPASEAKSAADPHRLAAELTLRPVTTEPPEVADSESASASPSPTAAKLRLGRTFSRASTTSLREASAAPSRPATSPPVRQGGLLGWQAALAEERMCEPEVVRLVQEYQQPLRLLFQHYASGRAEAAASRREGPEGSEASSTGQGNSFHFDRVDEQDFTAEDLGSSHARQLMSPIAFQTLLQDLHLYPEIVQIHSLRQHLHLSLSRDGLPALTYPAFVECLLRTAFVYLSIYGNNIQQEAPSKWMGLWLFGLLSVRCRALGPVLGLPEKLSGGAAQRPKEGAEEDDGAAHCRLWPRDPVDLDSAPLRRLTLHRTIDAELSTTPEPHTPLIATPIPLASRPVTVCSVGVSRSEVMAWESV